MNKVLVICGPTATGKTKFGIHMAQKFNGEIISADSRQVYIGKDLIHGKDLPLNARCSMSDVRWRGGQLKYYSVDDVIIWLYDVVQLNESFNVAFWKECADLVIADVIKRHKLPIVVGGTGLYIKSLSQTLADTSIPPIESLRTKFQDKSPKYLFNYLNRLDSFKAASLNTSDRHNPRRLIRAIEISLSSSKPSPSLRLREGLEVSYLQIGLTAPRQTIYQFVDKRVTDRIAQGAALEDQDLASHPQEWMNAEHAIVRHQLTWFAKQPNINWFDITSSGWKQQAGETIQTWYNKNHAP